MEYVIIIQLILIPIQGLLFLATKREREANDALIKEAFKQALKIIVTRRSR